MVWLRLTLFTPLPGQAAEVRRHLDDLEDTLSTEQGYLLGGVFASAEASQEMGRFSLWRSQEEADRAANLPHVLAVRSQIHNLIHPGHTERLAEVSGVRHNLPE